MAQQQKTHCLCSPRYVLLLLPALPPQRLLSFLKPKKRTFGTQLLLPANMIYARVALQLVRVLLSTSPEAAEYPFLTELAEEVVDLVLQEAGKEASSRPPDALLVLSFFFVEGSLPCSS